MRAPHLASEQGFALPTVMLMTFAALTMAAVAIATSIQGQSGTVHDRRAKTALSVAESGVSQALLHYNRGVLPCEPAVEGGWCGPVAGAAVNGGQIAYWARLAGGQECGVANEVDCVEIVSAGTVDGVTRRVSVRASSVSSGGAGPGPFATAGVLSQETIVLKSNAVIHTGTATNGDIEMSSNARQCGPASVGLDGEMETSGNAAYYADSGCTQPLPASSVAHAQLSLPAVNPGTSATVNDNHRFFALDQVSGFQWDACWNRKDADGTSGTCGELELRVKNNSSVTLTGSVYSFCKLTLESNSALYVATGTAVSIYFRSPEDCKLSSGARQLDLQSNSRITSASSDPVNVAMLFVGSESRRTKVVLNSNTLVNGPCEQNFVIYAPRTDVELASNSRFCGAVAGRSVKLDSNSTIWSASGSDSYNLPEAELPEVAPHYEPYRFVECAPAPSGPPNAGC